VEPPQEARGSTEDEPTKGQPPIYTVPIIWDPCVLKWKNTEIACKIIGFKDPSRARSCYLADREGMEPLSENDKKWLANFLVKVPPNTTWGNVQVRVNAHQPLLPTAGTANAKTIPRRPWTADLAHPSCRGREPPTPGHPETTDSGGCRIGKTFSNMCPRRHPKPNGDQRRTPDTCGLNGIRIGEAKNPGPGSESQSSTSILEQGETTRGHGSRMGGDDPSH
jgi:hypothetical protein